MLGNASSTSASLYGSLVSYTIHKAIDLLEARGPNEQQQRGPNEQQQKQKQKQKQANPSLFIPFNIDNFMYLKVEQANFSKSFLKTINQLWNFIEQIYLPNEYKLKQQYHQLSLIKKNRFIIAPLLHKLQAQAKAANLWNLFLSPNCDYKHKLYYKNQFSNYQYAILCEILTKSLFSPEIFNCAAPDTGNMEILSLFATSLQQELYLKPLLNGTIRSCFAMTEPLIASSDALNIQSTMELINNEYYVINGRKHWISGALDPRCTFCIFLGKDITLTANRPKYKQHSMIIIPLNSKGITIVRSLQVFGYDDAPHGHAEIIFDQVKVDKKNLIKNPGDGFFIAQARLGLKNTSLYANYSLC